MQKKTFFVTMILSVALFALVATNFAVAAGLVPCGDARDADGKITDMCTLCHLIVGIRGLIDYGLLIAVFVALTALVVAGIIYIVSSGSESLMTMAKGFIANVLKGFAFVLIGWLIINTIMYLLGVKFSNFSPTSSWVEFECSDVSVDYTNSTKDGRANCSGSKPSNATACSTANPTTKGTISLVSTCPTGVTCDYKCNSGYELKDGECLGKDKREKCTGTIPSHSTACDDNEPVGEMPITAVDYCTPRLCFYKCDKGYHAESGKCMQDRVEGATCGYNLLGTCKSGTVGISTCPDGFSNYSEISTTGYCSSGYTCCIEETKSTGTCGEWQSTPGQCFVTRTTCPGDWQSLLGTCSFSGAKCCQKKAVEGEACGENGKGKCEVGTVTCSGNGVHWTGGTVCAGTDLRCCISVYTDLGTCKGGSMTAATGHCLVLGSGGSDEVCGAGMTWVNNGCSGGTAGTYTGSDVGCCTSN
ncbi:YIP1 family protein [Patescibacteria group bacterium]|nr:MAG: YIP1 family protein [Patescibacteria group bacterium]